MMVTVVAAMMNTVRNDATVVMMTVDGTIFQRRIRSGSVIVDGRVGRPRFILTATLKFSYNFAERVAQTARFTFGRSGGRVAGFRTFLHQRYVGGETRFLVNFFSRHVVVIGIGTYVG